MQKISGTVITLNEEHCIERCLQSMLGVVDEIIVVDSYSTDGTKKICENYGVRFIEHPFAGYVEQKNWALEQAENDIILSLDADEALSDELRENILKIKKAWVDDGYYFSRTTHVGNTPITHGSWFPDYKIRLWNRRKGKFGGTNPHDYVIMQPQAKVKRLKGTILHYSFATIDDFYKQSKKFAQISAKAMYEKSKKITPVMQILKTIWAFYRSYIFKFGFLDGKYGFLISREIANYTYRKYSQLRIMYKK